MKTKYNKLPQRAFYIIALLFLLISLGCAKNKTEDSNLDPPMHPISEYVKPDVKSAFDVYDPFEPFNRRMYSFNYYFDTYFYLPIINGYEFIVPNYAQIRVGNFIDNAFEFTTFTNNVLQLKMKDSGTTLLRFVINTTVGIAGLWDVATDMGITQHTEDFGQTLGHYGVGAGPYLVLPIWGPSNLRDTAGLITDTVAYSLVGPPALVDDDGVLLIFTGLTTADKRRRESFRYYQTGSPFEYDMIRMLYQAKREIMIDK